MKEESLKIYATYLFECFDRNGNLKWREEKRNLVPTVGKNKFLDATLKTGLASPAWYVGLKNTGAPAAGDTMSSHASWTENTSYTQANRPALTLGAVSGGSVNNSASKASFTMNATTTIFGAFVTDSNTKGGTTGVLLSVSDFASSKAVDDGDTLAVTVTFTAA